MSVSAAVPAAVAPTDVAQATMASQNLFEHMAAQAKGMPSGASPNQIGENLMERLNGYIDRSRGFSEGAARIQAGTAPVPAQPGAPAPTPGSLDASQMDRLLGSLTRTFDYAIETQMVVRGATQVSGSANTLLRGQ